MKKIFSSLILFMLITVVARSQSEYQPYSFQLYQKLNKDVYSPANSMHTALKPYIFLDSGSVKQSYDAIMNRRVDTTARKSWLMRKLFNEHLFDDKSKEFTFYLDYLPDLQLGKEFINRKTTWLNTRGFQAGGTIGSKFFYYTSAYENQAVYPNYLHNYINVTGMIPGEAFDFNQGAATKDWMYATTLLGYKVSKSFTIEAGIDKTFIGDGYRSMLLSDYASNYPLIRLRIDLGKKVQYMAMWAYLQDQFVSKVDSSNQHPPHRVKYGVFHYIDWNITNRASLGFFNALIAPDAYNNGQTHGFDLNYINPVLFSKSLAPSGPIPDHTLFGFNGKYKVLDKTTVYGQVVFDESASNANSKYGEQIGVRGADLFAVKSFNYIFEFNTAKPYTYSDHYQLVNYTDFSEPLAHPFGANFKEILGILNYSIGRFDLQGELNYAKYGLNINNLNYGKNIETPVATSLGNNTGQGLNTSFKYAEGRVSYVLNPKYNLRLEVGGVFRQETNAQYNNKTAMITFGLRSTFRNLYTDF